MSKKKKILLILIGIAISIAGVLLYLRNEKTPQSTVAYICADQKKVDIVLKKNGIDVTLEGKEHVRFRKDISNDVASRYVSKNPQMVLWMNNKYIMIEKENTVPYYDCSVGGPVADELSSPTIQIPSDQVELAPKVK